MVYLRCFLQMRLTQPGFLPTRQTLFARHVPPIPFIFARTVSNSSTVISNDDCPDMSVSAFAKHFDLNNTEWWLDKANQICIPVTAILFTVTIQKLHEKWRHTERGTTRNWVRRLYWISEPEYLPVVRRAQKHRSVCAGSQEPSPDSVWQHAPQYDSFERPSNFSEPVATPQPRRVSDGTEHSYPEYYNPMRYLPDTNMGEQPRRRSP